MRTPQHSPEKVCFAGAAVILAVALYYCIMSAPLTLRPSAPVSRNEALPMPSVATPLTERGDEEAYVYGGVDPRTGQRVNRERMYPFEPYVTPVAVTVPIPAPSPSPAPQPANSQSGEKLAAQPREFAPLALAAAVEYTGVFSANGNTYGLLNRKDGSGYLQVKDGTEFTIGGEQYRVERLEKQAICVSCGGVCVILKNLSWDGELPPAQKRGHGESRSF